MLEVLLMIAAVIAVPRVIGWIDCIVADHHYQKAKRRGWS